MSSPEDTNMELESFTYEGVEYSLYDCVYLYCSGSLETDIGKLVKIYDTEAHEKKLKVLWFLRPAEIRNFLGDYEPRWNEIFLASGEGVGLSNINSLESIKGKCNVVCTSKDKRNPQPSEEELRMASYIFCRAFDAGRRTILENFPDEIGGIKVERFFNGGKSQKLIRTPKFQTNFRDQAGPLNVFSKLGLFKVAPWPSPVKNDMSSSRVSPAMKESEKAIIRIGEKGCIRLKTGVNGNGTESAGISRSQVKGKRKVGFTDLPPMRTSETGPRKKMIGIHGVASTKGESFEKNTSKTAGKAATQHTGDRGNWFKKLPWEQRLQKAQDAGTLVLLDNLDPSYASSEVEDFVWRALNEKVEAKMIPCSTFSNSYYGKAFVIFKSKIAAESAISELMRRCLILADGRPVVGIRRTLKQPDKTTTFVGHLTIDKIRLKSKREEMRKAVSTAHRSQPNTIEYDMAMEWCELQERSDLWWNALYKEQMEEIKATRRQLKSDL